MKKKIILLINVGTPDKPNALSVAKYLFQFLNDKYVIDIPWFFRTLLVNLIIIPFRARKSAERYRKIFTDNGSPLLNHLNNLTKKLQEKISEDYLVLGAMRYGNPSVKSVLMSIEISDIERVIVVPLYPQYATSTTKSAKQHVLKTMQNLGINTEVKFVNQFYNEKGFIQSFANQIKSCNPEKFDHLVFSFHGLPVNQVEKNHPSHSCNQCSCTTTMPEQGKLCYKACCYETTRLLANELSFSKNQYSVAFQSRLTKNWIKPFTKDVLLQLLTQGKKKILVVAPSFVADCLETTYEIGMEYKQYFLEHGGEELVLVESLNSSDQWVNALKDLIEIKPET